MMFKQRPVTKIIFGLGLLATSTLAFAVDTTVTPIKNESVVAQTPADDAKLTNVIKQMISKSKTLSKLNVEVSTNKGVVSLIGTVDSDSQAGALVEVAESVVGVSDVDTSKLTVKGGEQPLADTVITAKIKGLFIREKLFGEKDISAMETLVETKDGVVYLTGVVDNQQQIDNAIEIIKKNVPEVKKVEYNVKKFTPEQK